MRIEKDHLGEIELPLDSLHGIHTERALRNFPLGGERVPLELIRAIADAMGCAIPPFVRTAPLV